MRHRQFATVLQTLFGLGLATLVACRRQTAPAPIEALSSPTPPATKPTPSTPAAKPTPQSSPSPTLLPEGGKQGE